MNHLYENNRVISPFRKDFIFTRSFAKIKPLQNFRIYSDVPSISLKMNSMVRINVQPRYDLGFAEVHPFSLIQYLLSLKCGRLYNAEYLEIEKAHDLVLKDHKSLVLLEVMSFDKVVHIPNGMKKGSNYWLSNSINFIRMRFIRS